MTDTHWIRFALTFGWPSLSSAKEILWSTLLGFQLCFIQHGIVLKKWAFGHDSKAHRMAIKGAAASHTEQDLPNSIALPIQEPGVFEAGGSASCQINRP